MDLPLLTVVIPTRNRRPLLEEAIRSALLPLPFSHEVLVSDNASTDSTPEIQGLFPSIRYIRREQTLAMAEHWNLCVQEAKGRYVKVLCDDDWLLPGALEREVAALKADPGLSACASLVREVLPDGAAATKERPGGTYTGLQLFRRMLGEENLVGPPSVVTFRKESFGGFPAGYRYATDWAAWILLADRGPIRLLSEPGACFRLHENNLTNRYVEEHTDFVEVMALRRECLARLRGTSPLGAGLRYQIIFFYRFLRRLARLSAKRKSWRPFIRIAFSEKRAALPQTARSGRE